MILYAVAGGVLVGIAASILLLFNGRIMGASGIAGVLSAGLAEGLNSNYAKKELFWRFLFVSGLVLGGWAVVNGLPNEFTPKESTASTAELIVSGLLVGIGTRMGWGCTSGHGVCGLARLSGRSLISTIVFISAGIVTLLVKRFV